MRPRLYTVRNFVLFALALLILGGTAYWLKSGMPLPGLGVASTAGKIAYLSDSGSGQTDLYMMNADGSAPALLTANVNNGDAPAWSSDGGLMAFIAAGDVAKGKNPQVSEMNAAPGALVAALTQTSSSKAAPIFGPENRVYYLASGQLVATTSDGTDSDKIFPTFDEQKMLQGTDENPGILTLGGISRVSLSPDAGRLAISLKTEHGEALLLYETESKTCALLGAGERVFAHFLPDGKLVALFRSGAPLRQALVFFNADVVKAGGVLPAEARTAINSPIPSGQNFIAFFDATGAAQQAGQIPFAPDSFSVSPDGQYAAIGQTKDGKGENAAPAGAYVLTLASPSSTNPFKGPVDSVAFSPDSKQIALASGGDIYVAPADGSAPAKNLTNGKGKNSLPVWSPAKAK